MGCIHSVPRVECTSEQVGFGDRKAGVEAAVGDASASVVSKASACKADEAVSPSPVTTAAKATDAAETHDSSSFMVVWREPEEPEDEQQRWNSLCSYNILDTEPEPAYDRITTLCRTLFKVSIAMITFVDRERVWLKSIVGLPGLKQVERRQSICAWTLLSRHPEALVVPDLSADVRFKDYPVVTGWPFVRFYAASPLVASNGDRIGTLCMLDTKPREFTAECTALLAQLAVMVMRELERKRAVNDKLCTAARKHGGESVAADPQGVMLVDASAPKWPVLLVNDAWVRATGVSHEMAAGAHFWDLFAIPTVAQEQACKLAVEQTRSFELRVACTSASAPSAIVPASNRSSLDLDGPPTLRHGGGGSGGSFGAASIGYGGGSSAGALPVFSRGSITGGSQVSGGCAAVHWVRMQFRSATSADALKASHSISIPPMLPTADAAGDAASAPDADAAGPKPPTYYWATIEVDIIPSAPSCSSGAWAIGTHTLTGMTPLSGSNMSGASTGALSLGSPAQASFSLLPDDNPFADITLGSLLGWGSYGRVHRGHWNGVLVAVKVLEQVPCDFNARTSLEPLLHHRLSHPHVVRMLDVSTQEADVCDDGQPLQEVWMVLEYCNRGTLWDAISRGALNATLNGQLVSDVIDPAKVVSTAREIAGAMTYLHSQNVLHGDLNGNNILLVSAPPGRAFVGGVTSGDSSFRCYRSGSSGSCSGGISSGGGSDGDSSSSSSSSSCRVSTAAAGAELADMRDFLAKVGDFGLSRTLATDNDTIITRTHGTITHMAPEVITHSRHSKAADVYSFGVVLWELAAGHKAYQGLHYAKIVQIATADEVTPLPPPGSKMPPALLDMVQRCMSRVVEQRPTFAELHDELLHLEVECLLPRGLDGAAAAAGGGSCCSGEATASAASPLAIEVST